MKESNWLKLTGKWSDFVLMICVCSLPPIYLCRYVNGADFFDTLLSHKYRMQNDGMISGDFNSRCGDMPDYRDEDVDTISDYNVLDMTRHLYGKLLCNFPISASMCMLNGRKYVVNDFTCKDASLVDYVFYHMDSYICTVDLLLSVYMMFRVELCWSI